MSRGSYRVAAVLLAAGLSKRFGERNKLLAEFEGRPLVRHVARRVLRSRADPVIVVTGHDHAGVAAVLSGLPLEIVHNPDFDHGMSSTLRTGIAALGGEYTPAIDGAMICLADMPWVGREQLDTLIEAFDPAEGRSICVPVYDRRRGNPVLWAAGYFGQIEEIRGDMGARELLVTHAASLHEIAFEDAAVSRDIDSPQQLRQGLEQRTGAGAGAALSATQPDDGRGEPWRR